MSAGPLSVTRPCDGRKRARLSLASTVSCYLRPMYRSRTAPTTTRPRSVTSTEGRSTPRDSAPSPRATATAPPTPCTTDCTVQTTPAQRSLAHTRSVATKAASGTSMQWDRGSSHLTRSATCTTSTALARPSWPRCRRELLWATLPARFLSPHSRACTNASFAVYKATTRPRSSRFSATTRR